MPDAEPMFTYEELALLDSLVNPAKWALRREIAEKIGMSVLSGGDEQHRREAARSDRQRFDALNALSAKVVLRRREASAALEPRQGSS